MDLKDFTDMGSNIDKRVNYSVNHMNFDNLEFDVRQEFNVFFGPEGGPNPNNMGDGFFQNNRTQHQRTGWQQSVGSAVSVPVPYEIPETKSGTAMVTVGVLLGSRLLFRLNTFFMLGSTWIHPVYGVNDIVPALLFLGGLTIAIIGIKRIRRGNRFKQYLRALRGERFCAIKDMAKRVGKKPEFVCRDLSYMIEHGFFIEGHIDDQKTCFIGTDELYQQYVQARDSAKSNENSQAKTASDNKRDSQTEQIIAEGEASMRTIREANDAIYDQAISEKLYRMERIIGKIFDYVREKPEQAGQLRRFTSYYMPMTEKLVTAYQEMDKQAIEGENITKAKNEISNTLDTINEAYEKLYDSMYVDVAMDVSSDIAVLKNLFAQEGLAGDEMNGGTKTYKSL